MQCAPRDLRLDVHSYLNLRFIFTYLFIFGLEQRIGLFCVAPDFFHRIQKNKEKGIDHDEDAHS